MSAPAPTVTLGDPWSCALLGRKNDPDAGVLRQNSAVRSRHRTGSSEDTQVLNNDNARASRPMIGPSPSATCGCQQSQSTPDAHHEPRSL